MRILKTFDFIFKKVDNKEIVGGRVKSLIIATFLFSLVLAFQNCGDTSRQNTVLIAQFVDASSACDQGDCSSYDELLWMQIREYEPYKVPAQNLGTHFTVGGQCGTAGLRNHSFRWQLREGFGAQRIIASNSSNNTCVLGQFQVPIIFGSIAPDLNSRYQLSMEIIGYNDRGEVLTNSLPASQSSIDVIFFLPSSSQSLGVEGGTSGNQSSGTTTGTSSSGTATSY